MTLIEAWNRIMEVLRTMLNGEIRLIVRDGQIKYVNYLKEYIPPDLHDQEETKL